MFLSIRDFTVKWVGYSSLFEGLRELGINSFELFVGRDLKTSPYVDMGYETKLGFDISSRSSRVRLAELLEAEDLGICAMLIENDFSRPNLEEEVAYVAAACKAASDLGVNIVRINAVMREIQGYSLEDYVRRTVKALEDCIGMCRDLGVSLALENHGIIANRRGFLRELLGRVGEEVGLTLDTGNFYWFGYPLSEVYDIIWEFVSRVKHTHVKNARTEPSKQETMRMPGEVRMTPLYEGDIDLKKIIDTLKSAGYDYDLNIEDESLSQFEGEERLRVLKKDVEFLRRLLS